MSSAEGAEKGPESLLGLFHRAAEARDSLVGKQKKAHRCQFQLTSLGPLPVLL